MSLITDYRPKRLEDVVGQNTVIKAIKSALGRKSVPKAWLFTGNSGCGKTTISRILAKHFAGDQYGPSNIVEIDAATNTGIDEIRQVTTNSHHKAIGSSPVKSIIVDEIHRLSGNAFDALLKEIEHPPQHVFWLFCSTNASKIPETIKTRCIKFTLKPVDETEIFDLLVKISEKEKLGTGADVLEAIAENSSGSPRQALSNLELCAHCTSANTAKELMRSALQMKGPVDLVKLLIRRDVKPKWTDITKCISSMENVEAETVRIVIVNYLSAVLMNTKNESEVQRLLSILDNFSTPYNSASDKLTPLLLSIGMTIYNGG
jgi:DNA polymerase-3 subunit gamma/tau